MLLLILVSTIFVAKKEKVKIFIELNKLLLSLSTVFLGVFFAQYVVDLNNSNQERKHIIKLLTTTHYELEAFGSHLQLLPKSFFDAKARIRSYTIKSFFNDNPVVLPRIIDVTLADTSIIRTMHPQSASTIFVSLDNTNKVIRTLNERDFSENELRNLLNITSLHLKNLADFVDYEIMFQSGEIDESELFKLHKEKIKISMVNEISPLVRLK